MDGLSTAVTVATLLEISAKIIPACYEYYQKVKSARSDIERLRLEVLVFEDTTKKLLDLSQSPHGRKLAIGEPVAVSLEKCTELLKDLEQKLQRGTMRKFGFRAFKWPLSSKEMDKTIATLKRHELTFNTVLGLNQMNLAIQLDDKFSRSEQERYLAMLPYATSASFDSFTWQNEPLCHQDTRVDLMEEIREWRNGNDGKCVYWLNGMAGTGKSTIARTLAHQIHDIGRPCGTFFFSRGDGELAKAEKLWSTLAFSLARKSSLLLDSISRVVKANTNVGYLSLREQWKQLIYGPLAKMDIESGERFVFLFVIDALDECDNEEDVSTILELLSMTQSFKRVRLCVFVTSRPEVHIRLGFHKMPYIVYRDLILHNVDRSIVSHDIRVFLSDEMRKIRARRQMAVDWPGEEAITILVERADCLFIYAATACRYIGGSSRIPPEKRLEGLLSGSSSGLTAVITLDKMYMNILMDSLAVKYSEEELTELSRQFQLIIGGIALLYDPLSASSLAKLLEIHLAQYADEVMSITCLVNITLDPFASLLNIPASCDLPVKILHPSFRDFLTNKDRCINSHFYVDSNHLNFELGKACLHIMNIDLKFNLCNLHEPGLLYDQIECGAIRRTVPPYVQYACRYWLRHAINTSRDLDEIPETLNFFTKNILKWLEVVLLFGQIGDIIGDLGLLCAVRKAKGIVSNAGTLLVSASGETGSHIATDFDSIIIDLLTFVKKHRATIECGPYQLYMSALLQTPQDSVIRKMYQDELPSWITTTPMVERTWDASLQTFEAHSDEILDLSVSRDGNLIVSGSKDGTVKLCDLRVGALEATLDGHSAPVQSVAFSIASNIVASGSKDFTARIWRVKTGACLHVLEGHTDVVQKVVISPRFIATGSRDGDIRVWDISSGALITVLTGEAGAVTDLALSSDGNLLTAGYNDGPLCLWNLVTHSLLFKLQSHKSAVNTVLFSHGPRGHIVASGSYDRTIKIWSIGKGELVATFSGHTRLVKSIAFSSSGAYLASASFDNTIKIWDVESGELLKTFIGHSDALIQVAFSKISESILVSAGKDRTIRVWDVANDKALTTFKGHSRTVNAVAWAPQGHHSELLASASRDCTIRIWDPHSTRAIDTYVSSHSDAVSGIEISPNGQLFATRSKDKSVKLWNISNGAIIHTFQGHTDWVSALAFSPNNLMLASGAHDHSVQVWSTSGYKLAELSGHTRTIVNILFSPDNIKIASYSYDRTVKVWTNRGQLLSDFNNHTRQINFMHFSSDSMRLVSASYNCTVAVYNLEKNSLLYSLKGHIRSANVACFSPDGKTIASGSKDHTVKIWNAADGYLRMTLRGHENPVVTLLFSPDCSKLISRSGHLVNIWNTASGHLLSVQTSVAPFMLDMATSATWSSDGTILVKQIAPGQSEDQLDYRYARKVLRLSSCTSDRGRSAPRLVFKAYKSDENVTKIRSESQFAVSEDLQWITCDRKNVLFLPGHLRPRIYAVHETTIVLGNGSGRVLVFGFDRDRFGLIAN